MYIVHYISTGYEPGCSLSDSPIYILLTLWMSSISSLTDIDELDIDDSEIKDMASDTASPSTTAGPSNAGMPLHS